MNGVTIKELEEGESYRYLGVDENVEYNGKINKERILKEYYRRVKAIWLSELNSRNKTVAHNSFAIPGHPYTYSGYIRVEHQRNRRY